jgi:hypothetical protein
MQTFSTGKLLLTSEYVILDGALALAVPTRLGQEFSCEENTTAPHRILWEAFHQNKPWLKIKINYKNWKIIETNIPSSAQFILKTLQIIQKLSLDKFKDKTSYHIKTNLQFPANFGWGSSSTLMVNLSRWANINAFELNEMALGGSGYDIAVAQEISAILYRLENNQRHIERLHYSPNFKNELILIHLNQKQDSREGINLYRSQPKSQKLINDFSEITKDILYTKNIGDFTELMELHEKKLSNFLKLNTIKEKYFADCPSFVKSLGAWGGDFVLSTKFSDYKNYFFERGFTTVLDYEDVVL